VSVLRILHVHTATPISLLEHPTNVVPIYSLSFLQFLPRRARESKDFDIGVGLCKEMIRLMLHHRVAEGHPQQIGKQPGDTVKVTAQERD
jgi:hypothetical protein